MFKAAEIFEIERSSLNSNCRFSSAVASRLSVLIFLLAATFATTSCGTTAQAAGSQNQSQLKIAGSLPSATVNEAYNAVLAVGGGGSPYQFTANGVLPPGVTLNPVTGSFVGKPTTAGIYAFEVVVTDLPRTDRGTQMFTLNVGKGASNGGGGGNTGNVTVSVSPLSATLSSSQKQQFTATVSGTSNTAVTWSATAGSVDSTGLFTAPSVTSQTSVAVTATSNADSTKSASAAVIVNPPNQQSLQITTGTLPAGQQGSTYNEAFTATGGTTPYSWSISAGTPPPGLSMSASGDFSGSPSSSGTYSFAVTVTDAGSKTVSGNFSVSITAGTGYDGPAQLPLVTVASSVADTPAPGSVIAVNANGNLQAVLNSVQCGNTITLQAGATYTGIFQFPAKNCDDSHWIIVRTSASDSSLPAEGQRLTPCYAGVASLTGRPQYSCNNPQNVLAKLVNPGGGNGPIVFQAGANHYRLLGLELTRTAGVKGAPTLVSVDHGFTGSYFVLDRSWLHGTTQDDTEDGFEMAGTSNVAVVDSYFSDFHCTSSTGACTDSHSIHGGTGTSQDSAFEIRDNFLEASGEAIMFGGGGASTTPTDITIHYNHFFKPWQWMPGNTPFQGGASGKPFVVKNHLELKNAVRVLAEGNLMEDVWGGFSQTGFAILLTPKNQHTQGGDNICPICQVTDVTIRYTHIAHGGGGIVMATVVSGNGEGGAPAKAGMRFSIHDVVMDDISRNYTGGLGRLFLIANGWPQNPVNTITINHITGIPDSEGGIIIAGNKSANPPMYGFVFTNNIVITGKYPVWNEGGGETSCAFSDVPLTSINTCFTTYTFNNNALVAAPSHYKPSMWPQISMFMESPDNVDFVQYNNGNGGNYELLPSSPYKGKGTDGKDLGADIVGLNEMLANVE
jgi:hypothetical protein